MIVPTAQSSSGAVEVVDCGPQLLAQLLVVRQPLGDTVGTDVLLHAIAHLCAVADDREQVGTQRLVSHHRIGVRDDLAQTRLGLVELTLSS